MLLRADLSLSLYFSISFSLGASGICSVMRRFKTGGGEDDVNENLWDLRI